MRRGLDAQVVVITGASSGIGARTAELAAEQGALPVLIGRSAERLTAVADRIASTSGTSCDVYPADVTDSRRIEEVVASLLDRYGRIDIWINCAGYGEFLPFSKTPMDKFRGMMEVNFFALVHCTQAVLPSMMERGNGRIIQVASMAGKIGTAGASAYAATKHAVLGMTDSLRQELRGTGIVVSAVNPGPVDTPFFDRADPQGMYKRNVSAFMLSADRVAREIIRVAVSGKAESDLPLSAKIGIRIYRLFPRLLDGVAARILNRK